MTRRNLIGGLAAAVVLGGAVYGWHWWTGSPHYALQQIRAAIEQHDVATFRKHVDLETFLERLVDDLLGASVRQAGQDAEDEWERLGANIGAGLVELLKPKMVDRLESEILQWVETGEPPFSEYGNGGLAESGATHEAGAAMEPLDNTIDLAHFADLDLDIEVDGKMATVRADFEHQTLGKRYEARLVMRDRGDHWTLTEWQNGAELIEQVDADKRARLAAANEAIYNQLYDAVALTDVSIRAYGREWSQYVESHFALLNQSDRTITALAGAYLIRSANGRELARYGFNWDVTGGMAPDHVIEETVEFDINPFIEDDAALFELARSSDAAPDYRLVLERVEFRDGETLAPYQSFDALPEALQRNR